MVVYFPKNGKSVSVNGIMIKRPGLPMQFPVKIYENWVEKGLLVKRPQDMDPISPEEMQRQVELARKENKPVFVQESVHTPVEGALVPKGIGEDYPSASYKEDEGDTNEYDAQLMLELQKMGVDTAKLMKDLKNQQETTAAAPEVTPLMPINEVKEEAPASKIEEKAPVEEPVKSTGGIFASFVKNESEGLTYEKALSMVKREEDGSLKIGKDGLFVLTPGAKPYSKAEICAAIKNKK